MALHLLPAEFWLYAYLGALFSGSWTYPLAVALMIWPFAVVAVHRNDPIDPVDGLGGLLFTLVQIIPFNALLGVIAALIVQYIAALPPLIRFTPAPWYFYVEASDRSSGSDIDGTKRVHTDLRPTIFTFAGVIGAQAFYLLSCRYTPEIFSQSTSIILGGLLLLLSLVMGIGALWAQFASARRAARADARYEIYLAFGLLAPLFNDSLIDYIPWNSVLTFVYIVLWAVIVAAIESSVIGVDKTEPTRAHEFDVRYLRAERYPARIWVRWLVFTALPVLFAYIVQWVASFFSDCSVPIITVSLSLYTLLIVIVVGGIGGMRSSNLAASSFSETTVSMNAHASSMQAQTSTGIPEIERGSASHSVREQNVGGNVSRSVYNESSTHGVSRRAASSTSSSSSSSSGFSVGASGHSGGVAAGQNLGVSID